jgi:hypothetical protein
MPAVQTAIVVDHRVQTIAHLLPVSPLLHKLAIQLPGHLDFPLLVANFIEPLQTQDEYLVGFVQRHLLLGGLLAPALVAVHRVLVL